MNIQPKKKMQAGGAQRNNEEKQTSADLMTLISEIIDSKGEGSSPPPTP